MKKVFLIIAVAGLMLASCGGGADHKYRIVNSDGVVYRTDNYTTSDGCISFQCESCERENVTICGSYTIARSAE